MESCGSVSKESAATAGAAGDMGSILGPGRSLGEGNNNALQYSCLGNHMDREPWRATAHGVPKSQTQLGDYATTNPSLFWIKSKF